MCDQGGTGLASRGCVVAFMGIPGCGKTTLCSALASVAAEVCPMDGSEFTQEPGLPSFFLCDISAVVLCCVV